ncbi:MAG: site-2 protease family protein [Caldilineaceae bacterium]
MADNTEQRKLTPFSREVSAEEAQALANTVRALVADDMTIEAIQTTRDQRQGAVVVHGRLRKPSHQVFTHWLRTLNAQGYTPVLRHHQSADQVELSGPTTDKNDVTLQVLAGVAPKARSNPWINLILFVITVLSTLRVGALSVLPPEAVTSLTVTLYPQNLIKGWPFAVTLLGILTAHEFGHYFAARYHKVAVTLPYFLPMPLGFGTLGAFIRLKEPVPDQRKLFDIGVAGPLAGVVLAIPLFFIGLNSSTIQPMPELDNQSVMVMGNSLLTQGAAVFTFGKMLPDPITGEDVFLSPVAFAAWIGLLVTALNLLPVGQLDGGHTVYALFGRKARYINMATLGLMAIFAVAGLEQLQAYLPVLATIGYSGWFVWLALIFFIIGPFHPPALDDVTTLDAPRRLIGYLVIVIFILTFVPVPFYAF